MVTRYYLWQDVPNRNLHTAEMCESEDGDWVKFASHKHEYDSAIAEIARLQALNSTLESRHRDLVAAVEDAIYEHSPCEKNDCWCRIARKALEGIRGGKDS